MEKELQHIRKIERIVCGCVNEVFIGRDRIEPEELYAGRTNIPLAKRIARGAVFVVAHDRFYMSYRQLSRYSGITKRNIMRSVRSYKDTPDPDINRVNEFINLKLENFPLL